MPVGKIAQQKTFDAYVVFAAGKRGTIWSAFCRRNWGHCFVMIPAFDPFPGLLSKQYTIKVEPQSWGIDIELWLETPEEIARQWTENGDVVVRYKTTIPGSNYIFRPRGLFSCVSIVKSVLGINCWRLLTPWHLFLYLVRNGGQLIKE